MSAADEQVEGWKDIATALRVHPNTAKKWRHLKEDPLPVRVNHIGVYAWRGALEAWCHRRDKAIQVDEELRSLRAEVEVLRVRAGATRGERSRKQARENVTRGA